jgi:hypothetical protein
MSLVARHSGMRLIHRRMRKLAPAGLAAEDDPGAGMALEKVRHLHGGSAQLQAEIGISLGLIAIDVDLTDVHIHHRHVDRAVTGKMFSYGPGDGVVVVLSGRIGGSGRS